MSFDELATSIAQIDADARVELVRNALHDRHAQPLTWRTKSMAAGASTSDLCLITGMARSRGLVVPWRFVVKMFNRRGQGWDETSTDPLAWNYWKREWLVYQTDWVHQPKGLVAPECLGVGEIDESAAWVAIEDLSRVDQRPWSPAQFMTCARDLGKFNGRFVTDPDPPSDQWLSRDWARGWAELAEPMISQLPSLARRSDVAPDFPTSKVELLLMVWQHRQDLLDALDVLQQSVAHNDVYPRNAFIDVTGNCCQTIAIDWAFCGWAPLGADLAPLLGASLYFSESDWKHADDLERLCLEAYMAGLRQTGCDARYGDIYLGYLISIVMRFIYGYAGLILSLVLDHSLDARFEQIFLQPRPVLLKRWRQIDAFGEARMTSVLKEFGLD